MSTGAVSEDPAEVILARIHERGPEPPAGRRPRSPVRPPAQPRECI